MNKRRYSQSGFSSTILMSLLIVAGALGFAGWYVWRSNQKSDNSSLSSNSSHQSENAKKADSASELAKPVFATLPNDWTEYKNQTEGLRLGYPKVWGVLSGLPLQTADYHDDNKNMQGKFEVNIAPKNSNFSVVARKYGATISPSTDGKTWLVTEENPAAVDDYKVGDTYETKLVKVGGAEAVDITYIDEDCTFPRWIFNLENSYAVVSIAALCPANLQNIPEANKTAYSQLISTFLSVSTVYKP